MPKHLLVARLWLEVNSFSPLPTDLAEFEGTEWARGASALTPYRDTPTELAAVIDFADRNPDWAVTVSRCASAQPGGPMDDALFDAFKGEVLGDLAGRRWDAVYLSLHGALATARRPQPELELLRAVRQAIGATPLGASFDMHANLGPEVVEVIDVGAGYKTLPHLDMRETAGRVLSMLEATVAGRLRPVGRLVRPGCILHSFNMRTTDGPMMELEAIARAAEVGAVLDVTPFGGFPYADTPYTGASVMVHADRDAAAADRAAGTLAAAMRARVSRFSVSLPDPAEGLRRAMSLAGDGPAVALESADNTYSGGIADTPGLFRALVEMKPDVPTAFAYFCDAALVERARKAGVGARMDCRLGGQVTGDFGPPVPVAVVVRRLTDGVFTNRGPMHKGLTVRMGPTAVLDVAGIQTIVTSRREPVNDTAYFDLHGIDVQALRLLCVKGKNHFRGAFAPLCRGFVEVDTPGPAGVDLRVLPYRYARKEDVP